MYTIVNLPPIKGDYAELVSLGDLHYGAPDQDRQLIKEVLAYAMATPNCYVVGVGDTLENAIKGKFGVIGEHKSLEQSMEEFKEDFLPIIKSGKFIGTVPGNHDGHRITSAIGSKYDPLESFFADCKKMMGIKIHYGCPHLILSLRVGRSNFTAFITHGSGGGGTPGSIANNMFKSEREVSDADIYLQGHFHFAVECPSKLRPYFDRRTGTVQTQSQFFISTSSFLKKGGYAAVGRFLNGGTNTPIIELYASPNTNHVIPKSIQTRNFRGLKQEFQQLEARGIK